jgi:hypothetical protein
MLRMMSRGVAMKARKASEIKRKRFTDPLLPRAV